MAAPTNAAYVKKALANSEPSTHGTFKMSTEVRYTAAFGLMRTTRARGRAPKIGVNTARAPELPARRAAPSA